MNPAPKREPTKRPKSTKTHPDSRRVKEYEAKVKDFLDNSNLAVKLYRDRKLNRREVEKNVLGFGYHIVLRQLGAMASNPDAPPIDTKAADLFLKRCDLYFSVNEERTPNPDEPAPFKTRKGKSATTSSEYPSSDYVEAKEKTASDGESTRAK